MLINDIIQNVIAGGLLGILGQGVRMAVGLKKFNDKNTKEVIEGNAPEELKPGRMVISIFIGFVAGAVGMLIKGANLSVNGDYSTESIVTIIAIGYSGADFIEGVFNTYLNKFSPVKPEKAAANQQAAPPIQLDQPTLVQDESALPGKPPQG